ncbi:MAG: ubiquinone/menaquinone biosynthesis methyltransferase [Deltaproteobacteria bacterium]|nr:ubiquinone/menaquinone biosynthesis methyltransferase [Deltaproteobacteria bacterium]
MKPVSIPTPETKRRFVQSMFDRIAPRYDLMNRLLTFGLDLRWRRTALSAIAVGPGDLVIDLACGTGDLCELAARRGARVVGVDFAREMLRRASEREVGATLVQGDALALPFASGGASALTCGFALRNFISLEPVLAECARVLRPGGRLAILEVDRPRSRFVRTGHSFYFDRVVPLIGALLSDRAAYRYLPESTSYLPPEAELLAMIERAGFTALRKRRFLFGAAQLVIAERKS